MTIDSDQYYCNQKFWWLNLNLEKQEIFSCCSASPRRIDLDWVKEQPGQLFNDPIFQHERKLMLDNQPVASCAASCWQPESQGLSSRRILWEGNKRTHTNVTATPEVLNITLGSDCNLTCVYCCKYYSSAWYHDVKNKSYAVEIEGDRYKKNSQDIILNKLSQKDLRKSTKRDILISEISKLCQTPSLKEIQVSGGEPFLYLDLEQMIQEIPPTITVEIVSGLGVNSSRFDKEVAKLPKNTKILISAENTGAAYEFSRFGNTWSRFLENIEILKKHKIKYSFRATVSNVTLPGLLDFVEYADEIPITFQPCTDPDFLSVKVLDPVTKDWVRQNLTDFPEFVVQSIDAEPTQTQIDNLKIYLNEFANRRQLDLSFLPESFISWAGIKSQQQNEI